MVAGVGWDEGGSDNDGVSQSVLRLGFLYVRKRLLDEESTPQRRSYIIVMGVHGHP